MKSFDYFLILLLVMVLVYLVVVFIQVRMILKPLEHEGHEETRRDTNQHE
jgi:hypothetical protein